jgi:glutathione peroxidase-family protein
VVARFSPGKKPASMASAIERLLDESHVTPGA